MWQNTKLTDLLDLNYPIIQAPMAGGLTTPELIAEVCHFGALGSLGAGYMTPEVLDTTLSITKALCKKPFNVNLFVPNSPILDSQKLEKMQCVLKPLADELQVTLPVLKKPFVPPFESQVKVLLDHNISIFSFTFGCLDAKWIKTFKAKNIFLIGTATSEKEAKHLEDAKVDAICLQGKEAGGHRGTFFGDPKDSLIPTFSLVESVVSNVKIPVIASGGIMNGQDILKAIEFGAHGVQMGSAFLTTSEAGTKPTYKKSLLEQEKDQTVLTKAFSGKYARAIPNRFTKDLQALESDILDYPLMHVLTKPIRDQAAKNNIKDYLSLWAGQRAFLCRDLSCSALLQQLINECEA